MTRALYLDGDWYGLTRAMYAEGCDSKHWAEAMVERLHSLIPHPIVGLQTVEYGPNGGVQSVDLAVTSARVRRACESLLPVALKMDRETVRSFFFPARSVVQLPGVMATLPPPTRGEYRRMLRDLDVSDGFAVVLHPVPGVAVTLFVLTADAVRLLPAERTALGRMGFHLESSIRLRRRPETLVAVLGSDGRVEYVRAPYAHSSTQTAGAALRRARRSGSEALGLWTGLVAGELSAVERGDGARAKTYFFENPPHRQPIRSLTGSEQDVVSLVCQGHSAKAIAYGLGISEAAVSMRLQKAATKVGLSSRIELVRLAAMLTRDPRARFTETTLTTAERDVLALLEQGLSNGEIAKMRGRSIRTIANQVSSLLSKTQAGNRKVLVAMGGRGVA